MEEIGDHHLLLVRGFNPRFIFRSSSMTLSLAVKRARNSLARKRLELEHQVREPEIGQQLIKPSYKDHNPGHNDLGKIGK